MHPLYLWHLSQFDVHFTASSTRSVTGGQVVNSWSLFSAGFTVATYTWSGSVAEWLACWTQAQKGLGSNRSRDAVG